MKPYTALWNYDTEQYDVFEMKDRPADMRLYVPPNSRPLYDWLINNRQDAWAAAKMTGWIIGDEHWDEHKYWQPIIHRRLFTNVWKALLDRYHLHQEGGHAAGFAACTHPNCREAHLLESVLEGVLDRE